MLAEIEAAVQSRLEAKLTGPKNVIIEEKHRAIALPGIEVIVAGGKFERVGQGYKCIASVFILVTFRNRRSTEERRKGVYPIVEAVVGWLQTQTLGLEMAGLAPKRMDNVTGEEDFREGKVMFQLEFETSFVVGSLSDEELNDLLAVGLNYHLQPDDEKADATDLVELG